jgi:malonate-semialdehyde dehydrogenase (acetylating)/methylmalonate-semialdehyde dehydrogenase
LTIGAGTENKDICPMITKASLKRAEDIIAASEHDGSKILLDGRKPNIPGYENGNFLGATIIDHSGPGMISYDEEIFAPVMTIVRVDTLDDAIKLTNDHP